MGPRGAGSESGRVGPSRALGINYSNNKDGPRGAGSGRAGPGRAEWAQWGRLGLRVGHALGFNSITLRLGPGDKHRPSGATWGRFAQ